MTRHYDVIIVGAGPAGAAAAYFLAQAGLQVALLDKADFPRDKTCGDGLTPRALMLLQEMGVLAPIEAAAYRCNTITLRYSETGSYPLSLAGLNGLPDHILIMPRLQLDDRLRQHALSAGAAFFPQAKVVGLSHTPAAGVTVTSEAGEVWQGRLVILATGANTTLLPTLGIQARPHANLAARGYFENVEGLTDSVMLFFDGVQLPGYGWVFPVSATTANVGCGIFFESENSQVRELQRLVREHPYLRRILRNARQVGPLKGYPIRTDFSPAHSGNDWALVVGEALGLVNPITGEGIDYALESGQMAAKAILQGWAGQPAAGLARRYRAALNRHYRYQLLVNALMQRVYFRPGMLDRLLVNAHRSDYLRRAIVDACFGSANPLVMFSPRTFWELLQPIRSGLG